MVHCVLYDNKCRAYTLLHYLRPCRLSNSAKFTCVYFATYTVFQKSDAKIQITAYLIRIKYPLRGFNYHLSDINVANFNKTHRTVSEQQLF